MKPMRVGDGRKYRRKVKRGRQEPREILGMPAMGEDSLRATMVEYLEALAIRQYSAATTQARAHEFRSFVSWCEERALTRPMEITRAILERYQRHLFYYRKADGQALTVRRQLMLLVGLRQYFRWLCRQGFLPANPAADLVLPRKGTRLPFDSLTAAELEKALAVPDVSQLVGLRDKAILEVMWATGLRRSEVVSLNVTDIRRETGTVFVRQGKGKKDRVVPLAPRALEWVERYVRDVRPRYEGPHDEGALFLADSGKRMSPDVLTVRVRQVLSAAGFKGRGSCHLFRHACATALLEGGADVRFVQELLGHANLETTQVYTHVTITKLKAVYAACHPAARVSTAPLGTVADIDAGDVLSQLEREVDEEAE